MAIPPPSIFRAEALEYRLRNQGRRRSEVTFPRLMARRVVIVLWILLGLLGVGGGAVSLATVPVSESGLAIVMDGGTRAGMSGTVAVVVPGQLAHRIETGEEATVSTGGGSPVAGTIAAIETGTLDAAGVELRLGLPGGSLSSLDGPLILVWVRIDADHADDVDTGALGQADIPIGSRQAGTFLPLVGWLFEE